MSTNNIIKLSKDIESNSVSVENYINENDSVVWVIDDFRELGLQWMKYVGDKNIKKCDVCKRLFKIKSPNSNQLYCKDCYKKRKNKSINESKKKRRLLNKGEL